MKWTGRARDVFDEERERNRTVGCSERRRGSVYNGTEYGYERRPSYIQRGSYTDDWETEWSLERALRRREGQKASAKDERPRKRSEYVEIDGTEIKAGAEEKMRRDSRRVSFSDRVRVRRY